MRKLVFLTKTKEEQAQWMAILVFFHHPFFAYFKIKRLLSTRLEYLTLPLFLPLHKDMTELPIQTL
jgi:hypothetical protein